MRRTTTGAGQQWEALLICSVHIHGALARVRFKLGEAEHTADGTGGQPSPGCGKRGSTDKTVITMLEAAGEVQGRAREAGSGGKKGERTHPVRVVGLKTRQILVCQILASHGSNYSPQIPNVFSIFCFIHKSNPDPA